MKRILVLTIILLTAALGAYPARAQLDYEVFTLDNGLRVILLEDHSSPMVGFYTLVGVGSGDEQPGETGLSHMFEHMMFRGTPEHPGNEFDKLIESSGGFTNAYTTEDMTLYYQVAPSETLPQVVELEADRIANLLINEEHLDDERGAVLSERRMRVENDPNGRLWIELNELAYGDHGYGWPVIGYAEDIEAYTVDLLRNFFDTWYSVDRLTVILAGDFEPGEARGLIEEHYGPLKPGPAPPPKRNVEPAFPENAEETIQAQVPYPMFLLAFYGPTATDEDTPVLDVIQEIMGGGDSARLNRRFVRRERSCFYIFDYFQWTRGPGLFIVGGQVAPGNEPADVIEGVREEFSRLTKEPVSERELQKAKNGFWAGTVRQLQTLQGRGETVAEYVANFGSPSAVYGMLDRYEAVTTDRITEVAAKYFKPENSAYVLMLPVTADEGGAE